MVRKLLIRKKSEHNEGLIGSLEELSLHQEDVEKIEHLNNWCKDLQILYFQSNLISKIENLNKLKKLQYLNLAINNIEKIENLERCESLVKLDLTLNFIGDIESVCSLKANIHLKHLYLTGNPCTDYDDYRDYIIAKLTQIETLDTKEVIRSERLKALQKINQTEATVKTDQKNYELFRAQQRERLANNPNQNLEDDEFWKAQSEHAPETRIDIARRKSKREKKEEKPTKKSVNLISRDGRPLNINQPKVDFHFNDIDPNELTLDVAIYKYLDTSLIDVDLQPIVVHITIKDKVFQFVLPEEIYVDKSTVQRSQITGHLLIKMPKVNFRKTLDIKLSKTTCNTKSQGKKSVGKNKYLEIGQKSEILDFSKIIENNQKSTSFNDDPEIPPLEYG